VGLILRPHQHIQLPDHPCQPHARR